MKNNIPPDSLQLRNEWFAEKQNHHRGSGDLLLLTQGSAIFKTPVISASKTESYRVRSSTSLCVFHYPQRTHRHLRELLIVRMFICTLRLEKPFFNSHSFWFFLLKKLCNNYILEWWSDCSRPNT